MRDCAPRGHERSGMPHFAAHVAFVGVFSFALPPGVRAVDRGVFQSSFFLRGPGVRTDRGAPFALRVPGVRDAGDRGDRAVRAGVPTRLTPSL